MAHHDDICFMPGLFAEFLQQRDVTAEQRLYPGADIPDDRS
jgi:hypothetical protein